MSNSPIKDTSKILCIQHNTARKQEAMHNILNIGYQKCVDIVAIQEPFIGQEKNSGEYYIIAYPSYNSLILQGEFRPRVVIFTRKASKVIFTPRTNIIMDTDI